MATLRVAKRCRSFLRPKYQAQVMQTAKVVSLFDVDKKSGYHRDFKSTNFRKDKLRETIKSWPGELKLYKKELTEKFQFYNADRWNLDHGGYEYLWKFGGQQSVDNWIVTADRDNLQGKSIAGMTVSKDNNALFHGYLCQDVPQDGVSKSAGYCSMRSPSRYISFKRKRPLDAVDLFSHLVLRVRGDGRPYYINLQMDRMFDVNWADQFNYTLYTRGGPYWQIAKIPFSKFFLSHKGRNQDQQSSPDLGKLENIGITMADGVEGPFQLEIDYIAVLMDWNHDEEHAYERYNDVF